MKEARYNAYGHRLPDYIEQRSKRVKRKYSRSISREKINDTKRKLNRDWIGKFEF